MKNNHVGTNRGPARETWQRISFDSLWGDVRYSFRRLVRSPGFTVVALLSLALGIGANTAIFSLLYTLILRTLPVRDPAQLVEFLHRYPGEPHMNGFSWRAYQLMREQNHSLSGLTAADYRPLQVRADGSEPQTLDSGFVDGTFFQVLGMQAALGRLIGEQDDVRGNPATVAVVSWSYWRRRFNLDPGILGRQIIVEQVPMTIVGVAPRKFSGMQVETGQDLWLPLAAQSIVLHSDSDPKSVWLVGRLRSGVTLEQARAELAVLYQSTLDEQATATGNPFVRKMKFEMEPAGAGLSRLREQFATPLLVLWAIVGLLLLIACTNVASMLLARGAARESEMAVRVHLGASRFRLVRQSVVESLLLSFAGSLVGVILAYFMAGALVRIIVGARRVGPPIKFQVQIDGELLLFAVAVALVTGLLFGLVPAVRALRSAPAASLREGGKVGDTRSRRVLGKALVIAQLALSAIMLSAAALFVGHLSKLESMDLGFHRDHVLLLTLDPAHSGMEDAQLLRAYQDLLERFGSIPEVRSVSLCQVSPIQGPGANRAATIEGYQPRPGEVRNLVENWIGPNYFETLGTPFVAGRDFNAHDLAGGRAAIVNQALAKYYFDDRDPVGKRILFDGDDQPYEIVGVVGDAKYFEIREPTWRTIYMDTFQVGRVSSQFALKTSVDPNAIFKQASQIVHDSLRNVTVKRITTLTDQVDASIVPERLIALLSGWLGALGALLTAIGLYGLLAYTIARRTNEIGIRMALGASRRDIVVLFLRDALSMTCVGLAIGFPVAFWGRHFAASQIQDLPKGSGSAMIFAAMAMIIVALVATYFPVRNAAHVDPMEALRHE